MAGSVLPAVLAFLQSQIFPEHRLYAGYRALTEEQHGEAPAHQELTVWERDRHGKKQY